MRIKISRVHLRVLFVGLVLTQITLLVLVIWLVGLEAICSGSCVILVVLITTLFKLGDMYKHIGGCPSFGYQTPLYEWKILLLLAYLNLVGRDI